MTRRIQLVAQAQIHVGVDVARAQLLGDEIGDRALGCQPKSTMTGMFAAVPTATAFSTGVHSGPR